MDVLLPSRNHRYTVIMLHGRDSTAAQFMLEFFESQASDGRTLPEIFPHTKWVFPSAPLIPSARFGAAMSQWFDMWSTEDPHDQEDATEITRAALNLHRFLESEAVHIPKDHIFLGGISQGCATAIHTLMNSTSRLGGFIGFSSWAAASHTLQPFANGPKQTPVFLSHCEDDQVIKLRYGEELRDCLTKNGIEVEWHTYPDGGHWINEPKGIDDLVKFLNRICRAES